MQYAIASILCFIFQNMSNKEFSRRFECKLPGLILFNAISFTFCSIAIALAGGIAPLSGGALILAICFAIVFTITIMLIPVSMSMGPMGTSVLIINMSMILPVCAGLIAWGESPTVLKMIGIACMVLVLILSSMGSGDKSSKRGGAKWLIITLITMVCNGALSIQQKLLSYWFPSDSAVAFNFTSFAIAGVICWVLVVILKMRGTDLTPWLSRKREFTLCAAGVGLGTAGGNTFQMLSLTLLPAIVGFPLVQGCVVLSLWLLSLIIYHDKATVSGIIALICGIAGIIMLSI